MQITDWLAVYAAALSTFTALASWASSRPRMRIQILPGLDDNGNFAACIIISNPSEKTLHVQSVGLMYPVRRLSFSQHILDVLRYGRWSRWWGWCYSGIGSASDGLPKAIEPHSSHRIFVAKVDIESMLARATERRIAAYAQDALGHNRYSVEFDATWL